MIRYIFLATLLVAGPCVRPTYGEFPELFNTEPIGEDNWMPAEEAAKQMKLPAGFRATVFAAEPDVQNPIAMAWDVRGRLWIAENYTYAEREQRFQLDLRDRVVIFDNTSGDQFKQRTVFTDNVTMLTGLEVGHDGVWLMCPPKLIFIPDRNHDDVPDTDGHVVLDGFTVAKQNYHNFANGLRFGPDGWLYGRCGGSCPGRIGPPGTPDHQRLALEGGIWRYHPTRQLFEVLTTGTTNPWGHDWDSHGEAFFINTVNGHLWHMIPGAHFTRPFLLDPNRRTYELIDFHADHWHFDTGQSWMDSRDGAANSYGGGHAHSGAMIYQGDNWPQRYRGKLFTLNFHGRRANQERLDRAASGYVGRHEEDFLLAADPWFRGMELSSGPDGGVFVLDWSDAGECHEHTGVHRTSGRIYKIVYDQSAPKRLDAMLPSDLRGWPHQQLVAAHLWSNAWYIRQARLELARRSAAGMDVSDSVALLDALFAAPDQKQNARVQTMLTRHILRPDRDWLQSQLHDADEHVRVWAIRLLTEDWTLDDALGPAWFTDERLDKVQQQAQSVLPQFIQLAQTDSSALVRLTLASTLQRLPEQQRPALATALVGRAEDAHDHNIPLMIWYGLIAVSEVDCQRLADVAAACRLPTTLRLISRCLAEEIENHPRAISRLLETAATSNDIDYQSAVLDGVSEGLKGWRRAAKPDSWAMIESLNSPRLNDRIRELSVVFGDGRALDELKRMAIDRDGTEPGIRLAALETLIQQRPDDLRSICESLLSDDKVNVMAARGLSQFDDPQIGRAIVTRYRRFRGPFRPQIISILVSRPLFARQLLQAVRDGDIPREDLTAFQVRQIHSFEDSELSDLVGRVWGEVRQSSREKQQVIDALKHKLKPNVLAGADKSAGRALFVKACQNCHRLYGEGETIGPDITGSNRGDMDYLLGNIVDPSSVVDKDFRMAILMTDDDRLISGLVTDESNRTITVQTATERLTFERERIQSRRMTDKSPMPDGLLDSLSDDQIRDLIAYLQHPNQVPLP